MDNYTFYLETEIADGEWREDAFVVTIGEFLPFAPGRFSGAPEQCYPDEGGVAYVSEPIYRLVNGEDPEIISLAEFLDTWAKCNDIKDDSYHTARQKAEEEVNGILYDECVEYLSDTIESEEDDSFSARWDDY